MKILLATETHGWSGGAAQTLNLALGLKKRGHPVWIACDPTSDLFHRAEPEHLSLIPMRIRGDLDPSAIWKIRQTIRHLKIDIVHAQHPKAHGVCLLAVLGKARPALVVTRRVSFPVGVTIASRLKYQARRIDRYIAVSSGIRDVLVQGGVPVDRIEIIHSGVDPASFVRPSAARVQELRQEFGLTPGLPVVIKVANYASWKGQSVFLKAAAAMTRQGARAQFVLAGRGTDGPEVAALVQELQLGDAVKCLGFRRDVADVLSLADLSVNAAIEGEGLSGALRESLLLGIPVAASDVSGNTDLVQEGKTGKVVPVGDAPALADAMNWVLTHPADAQQLAQKGRAHVLEGFTVDEMVRKTELLYSRLLDSKRPAEKT